MSTRTRRRLILCAVVVALTLPADLILVRAVSTDPQTLASNWVGSLDGDQISLAAADIQAYPFTYRKEIMRRVPAEKRAQIWVDHITQFRDSHPEFSAEQVDALNAAINAARATFATPGNATRAATRVVAERVKELFGADTAEYLMHRLGNRQSLLLVNNTPWHLRATEWVREKFVVQADSAGDCWCNAAFGCDMLSLTWCDGNVSCTVDNSWPACGWFWDEACDGVCKVGSATN